MPQILVSSGDIYTRRSLQNLTSTAAGGLGLHSLSYIHIVLPFSIDYNLKKLSFPPLNY